MSETPALFTCDGCDASVSAGDLYALIISLPNLRDDIVGEYCASCAEEIAEEETEWFA